MTEAYEIAKKNSQKSKEYSEERWRKRLIASELQPGDRVLVKNKREQGGPGKLRAQYEPDVYVVREKKGEEGVVYKVTKLVGKKTPERTLHRNMLMPCNLLDDLEVVPENPAALTRVNKRKKRSPPGSTDNQSKVPDESESDNEDEFDSIELVETSSQGDDVSQGRSTDFVQEELSDIQEENALREELPDIREEDALQEEELQVNNALQEEVPDEQIREQSNRSSLVEDPEPEVEDLTALGIESTSDIPENQIEEDSGSAGQTTGLASDDDHDSHNQADEIETPVGEPSTNTQQESMTSRSQQGKTTEGRRNRQGAVVTQQEPSMAPPAGGRVLRSQGRNLGWNPSMGAGDVILEEPAADPEQATSADSRGRRSFVRWIKSRLGRKIK